MASNQPETNLMSNSKVIELLLQLKSAKAHGKNYIKVKPHLICHLLCNRLYLLLGTPCTVVTKSLRYVHFVNNNSQEFEKLH